MVKKQIYIDEELARELRAVAARTGQAEAVHVRAALRVYLKEHRTAALDREPLLELIGLVDDPEGPRDVAEHHDRYLYGAVKQKR